jgi:hypothetical protein
VSSDDKMSGGPPNLTLPDKRRVRSFVETLCLTSKEEKKAPSVNASESITRLDKERFGSSPIRYQL